jgi:hypothetical protein
MSYQRHPLEITPLVFGLVFLGIVAGWALFEAGVLTGASTVWVLPVVLIAAGALGLVLAAVRPRETTAPEYAEAATEPVETTDNEEHRDD